MKTVAVVGGGFSGALFALKLHRIAPRKFRILVIERGRRIGRGVAYGACSPDHFLNVPVSRMEVGLTPRFGAWLRGLRSTSDTLRAFVAEGPGDLQSAFIPRELFGDYMEERFAEALTVRPGPGIAAVRGEAVGLLETPRRGLRLRDGRAIEADRIVLAMGNLPPRRPGEPDDWIYDTEHFIPDPWAADALADVRSNHSVLLLGAGLTMVDIALKLSAGGREGSMLAISRRGLLPHIHRGGGEWPRYVKSALPTSPRSLTRLIREQVAAAEQCGIPWQRVFDAARPAIPAVWNSWDLSAKRQFLRHLRRHWDVHRHRMAPRIATAVHGLIDGGRLEVRATRIVGVRRCGRGDEGALTVALKGPACAQRRFRARWIINCTGPRRDLADLADPLLTSLRQRGLMLSDALGLGLETANGALLDSARQASEWLFAIGPATCPAWWEIVAVPEISVQVDSLASWMASAELGAAPAHGLSADEFLELGAGI